MLARSGIAAHSSSCRPQGHPFHSSDGERLGPRHLLKACDRDGLRLRCSMDVDIGCKAIFDAAADQLAFHLGNQLRVGHENLLLPAVGCATPIQDRSPIARNTAPSTGNRLLIRHALRGTHVYRQLIVRHGCIACLLHSAAVRCWIDCCPRTRSRIQLSIVCTRGSRLEKRPGRLNGLESPCNCTSAMPLSSLITRSKRL